MIKSWTCLTLYIGTQLDKYMKLWWVGVLCCFRVCTGVCIAAFNQDVGGGGGGLGPGLPWSSNPMLKDVPFVTWHP